MTNKINFLDNRRHDRQVDIAPLGHQQVPTYLDEYGDEGAHTIDTDVVDLLAVLWARPR